MNLEQQLDAAEDHRLAGQYDKAKTHYQSLITEKNKFDITYAHALRGLAEVNRMLENYSDSKTFYNRGLLF